MRTFETDHRRVDARHHGGADPQGALAPAGDRRPQPRRRAARSDRCRCRWPPLPPGRTGSSSRCIPTPRRPSATGRRRCWPTISPTTPPRSSAQRRSPGRCSARRTARSREGRRPRRGADRRFDRAGRARARRGARVRVSTPTRAALQAALELGAIDERASDVASAVAGRRWCSPPRRWARSRGRSPRRWPTPPRTACSATSARPSSRWTALVRTRASSAGTRSRGPRRPASRNAREDLFEGATWYLTPTASTDDGAVCAPAGPDRTLRRAPARDRAEAHDRLMACVSHLPHVLANVLVARRRCLRARGARSRAARSPSLADAIRVAGANTAIWTDIYLANRAALIEAIDEAVQRSCGLCARPWPWRRRGARSLERATRGSPRERAARREMPRRVRVT